MTDNLPAVAEEISVVSYDVGGENLTLSFDLVRRYCVQGQPQFVTEPELAYFLTECKARKLNPLRRECFLIKYSQRDNAQIIEAIGSKRNRARRAEDCQGWTKGILLMDDAGNVTESEYPFIPPGKKLIGGYFRATPVGWTEPFAHYVELNRYIKKTRDGKITQFWTEDKQAEMIRKVAESQGLTALWGDQVGASHIAEEFPPDAEPVDDDAPDKAELPKIQPEDIGVDIYQQTNGEDKETPSDKGKDGDEVDADFFPDDDAPRERRPGFTARNAEYDPSQADGKPPREPSPPVKDGPPDGDALPFEQPPPETEDDPPTGAPLSWWDISKNWKHKRGVNFYLLVRIGLGLEFAPRCYQTTGGPLDVTQEYQDDYNALKEEYPHAFASLPEARPDIKRGVFEKMKSALKFTAESLDNFRAEIEMTKGDA